jgi:hypothetical protein
MPLYYTSVSLLVAPIDMNCQSSTAAVLKRDTQRGAYHLQLRAVLEYHFMAAAFSDKGVRNYDQFQPATKVGSGPEDQDFL